MPHKGESILVVDDDPQLSRTVCDILRIHGYHSIPATTGLDGLEIAARTAHELPVALVDLGLPDVDGLELVGRIKEVAELTQVVILTGNASLDSAVGALRKNSYDYLVKPVEPARLVATVQRGVQRWHHRSVEEELRRDRERFQLLVEAMSEVITIVTPDGLVQYQSPSAERTLGFGPGALAGSRFLDHVRPSDREAVGARLAAAAEAPGREESFEFHFRNASGAWCLLEGIALTLHDRPDTPVVLTCRDITERRRLEEELRQAQRMESIGRLAGGVAHDFNNQLTAILSAVDLASWTEGVPEPVREELSEIRLAAQRSARLTEQLLIFSRKDVTRSRHIDLNDVVEGMGSMLRRLVPENVHMNLELEPELPPVHIDPNQFEQVLLNLVLNARDALSPGGGTMSIRTLHQRGGIPDRGTDAPEADEVVVLEVEDDGEGMSQEVVARVFEPFFTTKEKGRGTGLGLATCYGIVTRADGTIRVRSAVGKGSTFQVVLPARRDLPAERIRKDRGGTGRHGSGVVLLVEDDDAVRRVLARILEAHGYEVLRASNGTEAMASIPDGPLDLLITDLVMPGMSGREVAHAVVALRPDVKVLYTSGYTDEDIIGSDPLPFGGDFVSKPVEAFEFLDRVAASLER